jgi:hypothetical protein
LSTRPAGRYISRCVVPADFLNEGRYVLGLNASSFRIQRYFQDEQAWHSMSIPAERRAHSGLSHARGCSARA